MIGVSVSRDKFTSNLGKKVADAQHNRLRDARDKGFAFSQEVVPEDRGTLRQRGFATVDRTDGSYIWGYAAPQAAPMEFGTEPGHTPPLQPLLEWSERVSDGPGLGYYVALEKIPREGVSAQPFVRPGAEVSKRFLRNHSLNDYLDI